MISKWTPFKISEPHKPGDYFIATIDDVGYREVFVAKWTHGEWHETGNPEYHTDPVSDEVTHWQPIEYPKPPED